MICASRRVSVLPLIAIVGLCLGAAVPPASAQVTESALPRPAARAPNWEQAAIAPASGSEAVANNPFTHLFSNLWTDLRHIPSKDNAWIVGVGGAAALAVHPADHELTFSPGREGVGEESFDGGSSLGGGLVQVGGAIAVYVAGRLGHAPRTAAFGSELIRAQVLDAVVTQTIKVAVNRTRPDGNGYSFPSGHASSTFATAAVIERYFGWKAGVPAFAAASYVAASRLSEGRHYLSDVVFGASLGIMSGRTVTVAHARFGVAPMASAHGVGISMVALGPR